MDAVGDLFIADSGNNVIREVNLSSDVITTVAGTGTEGDSGNGGLATNAGLDWPTGIAVNAAGDLFIADSNNNVIREVDHSTHLITTIAGTGNFGYSGNGGSATSAQLYFPTALAVDAAGDLFIADSDNNAVREVNLSTHIITTIAHVGVPRGLAVDGAGTSLSAPVAITAFTKSTTPRAKSPRSRATAPGALVATTGRPRAPN